MGTLFELLRIIIIFGILGGLGWALIGDIYEINEAAETYSWLGALAILVLLFVLYRNKLQFSGWYRGEGGKKLPEKISSSLIIISILLLIAPFFLGSLSN